MNDKTVLIISPEPWEVTFVSKHHYAVALAKNGNHVYFLNPPALILEKEIEINTTSLDGVVAIDYKPIAKGLQYFPRMIRNAIERRFIEKLENSIGRKFDVIWNFENSRFYDFRFARNALKIYHQVDLNQDFHVKQAALTADICFCTTDFIAQKIYPYNKKVYKIHHGVAEHNLDSAQSKPVVFSKGGRLKVTYIGNIDIHYFDVELFEQLVHKYTTVNFQLVGKFNTGGLTYKRLAAFKNVEFVGPVSSDRLKGFLLESDILLVCYKADLFREQLASPHKVMEYLASGKTVVATYTDEYKDKRDLLAMADSKIDYLSLFEHVINNLQYYNSEQMQLKRIEFAKQHTYPLQLKKIVELIEQNYSKRLVG